MASYLDSQNIYVPTGGTKTAGTTTAATATLTEADSGKVTIATLSSGTQTFTLPAAARVGQRFTFVCGHASGEILISVATGDNIVGKTDGGSAGTGIATATSTGIKNTAATNVVGDFVTLVSDGVTTWYMTSVAGVWASR